MTIWLIEPRDPLIARDGRPFDVTPGVRAESLAFPFPSTTTGALRTRAGSDAEGRFHLTVDQARQIAVRGPLLAEFDSGGIPHLLYPAPADAQVRAAGATHADMLTATPLRPLALAANESTSLPDELAPVGQPGTGDMTKSTITPPAFWHEAHILHWLQHHAPFTSASDTLGSVGPTQEERIHIKLDSASGTGEDGRLFATSGREFTAKKIKDSKQKSGTENIGDLQRLALAIESDAVLPTLSPLDTLGGERRQVSWRTSELALPTCPQELRESIHKGACRLLLLTPAYFTKGYRPTWLLEPRAGVVPQLRAVVCGRPAVVSGWDYATSRAKPTRRLAPAGSVYFVTVKATDAAAANAWIDAIWMQCVSDGEQDRRDGFGLAALGAWDGTLTAMED